MQRCEVLRSHYAPSLRLFLLLAATCVSVCVYGGMCFHSVSGNPLVLSTVGTGFGYLIACFFFLLLNIIVAFALRSDASIHLGSSAADGSSSSSDYAREDGTGPSDTTNYNPPAGSTGAYQYNAEAAAYAGSYNGGEVAPAQTADQNL